MDEIRFGRLEDKVDKIKDDVHEIKHNNIAICKVIEMHMETIEDHITGDNKIITKIEPLLNELPSIISMVKSYEVDKEIVNRRRQEKTDKREKITDYGKKIGLVSLIVGIITSVVKTFF